MFVEIFCYWNIFNGLGIRLYKSKRINNNVSIIYNYLNKDSYIQKKRKLAKQIKKEFQIMNFKSCYKDLQRGILIYIKIHLNRIVLYMNFVNRI